MGPHGTMRPSGQHHITQNKWQAIRNIRRYFNPPECYDDNQKVLRIINNHLGLFVTTLDKERPHRKMCWCSGPRIISMFS